MEKNSDSERRTSNRIKIPEASIKYKLAGAKFSFKNYSDSSSIIDISKSGLCFKMRESVSFGDPLEVKINFPDGNKFNLKGKIRWADEEDISTKTVGVLFEPFGNQKKYNPIKALEYLRSMKDQAIQKKHAKSKEEEDPTN